MVSLQVLSFQRNFILLLSTSLSVASMARYKSLIGFLMISYLIMSTDCSLVLEDKYTVDTLIDGNKVDMHPYAILPLEKDIIVLDSVKSSFFRIKLPLSGDGLIELFAGSRSGVPGFADGDLTKAAFNHPKAFTVDAKGNIYVADRTNFAIRKISKSGVSTIAGGMASKNGHDDGPSQNATFSTDFDLTFVPSICALLVSDRGNGKIRQIKLPESECTQHTELGTHWAGVHFQGQEKIQNISLMSMGKQVMHFFVGLSAVARMCLYEASSNFARPVITMFRLIFSVVFVGRRPMQSKPQQSSHKSESLLDADIAPDKLPSKMQVLCKPSENLIDFNSFSEASVFGGFDPLERKKTVDNTIPEPISKSLEEHLQANISAFRLEAPSTERPKCLYELKYKQEAGPVKGQFKQE